MRSKSGSHGVLRASCKSEKRVAFRNQDADPTDEEDWPNQHEWLVDILERLYRIFHPRLKRLWKVPLIRGI